MSDSPMDPAASVPTDPMADSTPSGEPVIRATVVATPVGPLSLLAHDGALVGAGFTPEPKDLHDRMRPALREHVLEVVADPDPTDPLGARGALGEPVAAYFAGDVDALDTLPVHQPGTPTMLALWQALRRVPAGRTVTYGQLAAAAGRPRAARVAGAACAGNLVAPIVPCHRVVPASGGLGGYYYGVPVKRWLLDHEATATGR